MKIIAKPIDVIACFLQGTLPMPYKFKTKENEEPLEVRVEKILKVEESKLAGIDSIVYTCQSIANGKELLYELKYIKADCRWELYRI